MVSIVYIILQFKMGEINKQTNKKINSKYYKNLFSVNYYGLPFHGSFIYSLTGIPNTSQTIYIHSNPCLRLCFWETQSKAHCLWVMDLRFENRSFWLQILSTSFCLQHRLRVEDFITSLSIYDRSSYQKTKQRKRIFGIYKVKLSYTYVYVYILVFCLTRNTSF